MDTILAPAASECRDRSLRRQRPLRVVIVEDSERILAHLEESLSEIDNVVVAGTVTTEDDALALLRQRDWDFAILDLQLRQGNGLRVLKAMHADPKGAPGKIAVFTNYAFPQYRERSMDLGADYFFDKSREFPRILEVVEDLASAN